MGAIKAFLRRLAANDKPSLEALLAPQQPSNRAGPVVVPALDRKTRMLVELAALLASDAGTTSVRWAVDRAAAAGADDATLVQVLLATASVAGSAQAIASAPRLALAIGLDLDVEGWDGT